MGASFPASGSAGGGALYVISPMFPHLPVQLLAPIAVLPELMKHWPPGFVQARFPESAMLQFGMFSVVTPMLIAGGVDPTGARAMRQFGPELCPATARGDGRRLAHPRIVPKKVA